jgi:hypothetical protein
MPGHLTAANRRSSIRSARWGTSSSRWSASRRTRCRRDPSSACACRWTTRGPPQPEHAFRGRQVWTRTPGVGVGMHTNLAARAPERRRQRRRYRRAVASSRASSASSPTRPTPGARADATEAPASWCRGRGVLADSVRYNLSAKDRGRSRPRAAGARTVPNRPALARDPGSDAAGSLGARRLSHDKDGVRRADHHGHREGLGGGQGDGLGARCGRLRHRRSHA